MTVQTHPQSQPSSPITTKPKHSHSHGLPDQSQIVPLDDARRNVPLHPSLQAIKVSDADPALNPLTLKPFTAEELKQHNYVNLRSQYSTPEAAARARDEAVQELKARMEEADRQTKEIERQMEEKEKTREIERKVYMKRRGEGGAG